MARKSKGRSHPGVRSYGTKSRYKFEKMEQAIADVRNGVYSLRKAADAHGVVLSTLKNKLHGRHSKAVGRPTEFSLEEEKVIVEHVLLISDIGQAVSMADVRYILQQYLKNDKTRKSRFKNCLPGREWARDFLRRHPEVKARFGRNISRKRAQVDDPVVNKFFDNFEKEAEGVPPENIFNFDESGFHDDPKRRRLLFRRMCRHPELVRNSTKSCYTVVFCGNAAGLVLPPYFIFKGRKKWTDWLVGAPRGSRLNSTISGWIDTPTFEDMFEFHILPEMKKFEGKKLLIGDNLSSHLSIRVLQLCKEHNNKFILLPPNATHLLQPLDVAVFSPLKNSWREVIGAWRNTLEGKKQDSMPPSVFTQLLTRALALSADTMSSNMAKGFDACGLYPVNREKILGKLPQYTKPLSEVSTLISAEFIEFLNTIRNEDLHSVKKVRKCQMPVEPGKSVSVEEVEKFLQDKEAEAALKTNKKEAAAALKVARAAAKAARDAEKAAKDAEKAAKVAEKAAAEPKTKKPVGRPKKQKVVEPSTSQNGAKRCAVVTTEDSLNFLRNIPMTIDDSMISEAVTQQTKKLRSLVPQYQDDSEEMSSSSMSALSVSLPGSSVPDLTSSDSCDGLSTFDELDAMMEDLRDDPAIGGTLVNWNVDLFV